jgi:uncharacterized protein
MKDVIVFTKVPERGYVKTQLQKKLPAHVVEELYTAFLNDTLDKLREYYPYVAYYPERKLQMLWTILGDRKYIVQRGKHMWEKLLNVFNDFYRMGVTEVVIVNCDVPTMKREHVEKAFELMKSNDLVFGPANDGGFYLIGGGKVSAALFDGVEWKKPDVLKRTAANAQKLGLRVAYTDPLRDVDNPEDLDAIWSGGELDECSRTYRILRRIKHS